MRLNRVYILGRLKDRGITDINELTLDKLMDIIEVCISDFEDELK